MSIMLDLLGKFALGAGSGAFALGVSWYVNQRLAGQALKDGELTDEILVVSNVVEDIDGVPYLKPRTVRHERPIGTYFNNKALAKAIVTAAKRAVEGQPETQLIKLPDNRSQGKLMKRVVNIASELGAPGHILRMFGRLFDKNDGYVCINYAQAGEDDWIIRIDIISAVDLMRFLDAAFVKSLSYRKEEGSHADNAAIFAFCAQKVFGADAGKHEEETRMYVRRVSIPTLKSASLDEVSAMIDRATKRKVPA